MNNTLEKTVGLSAHEKRALLAELLKQKASQPDTYPLSFAQQRLWFLDQLQPGSPVYNIARAMRIHGPLNGPALQAALDALVARHKSLRTTFAVVDGQPLQVVVSHLRIVLPVIDMGQEAGQEARARHLLNQEAQRPFKLTEGPLIRLTLLRFNDEEQFLLVVMHHIISDAWSLGVFFRELSALYEALAAGRPSPLPALPIHYADFAGWQREWLQGERLETHLAYWRRQLRAELPVLELPADRPRPPVQTFQGASHALALSPALSEALRALSRQEKATVFMTLLAAFYAVLYRYTGNEDIVVGSPVAGRNRVELQGIIGFFVNMLVLRANLSGDLTFRELLQRVRRLFSEAYAHQDLPFEQLVETLHPTRDLSRHPLFQVVFAMQNVPDAEFTLPGLVVTPVEVETQTSKFDLTLFLTDTGRYFVGSIEYSTDLFDAETIARMAGHYRTLLAGVAANPDLRLSELPLLTQAEKQKLLVTWNNTRREYPRDALVHQLFEAQAARTPEALAVAARHARSGELVQLTYWELNRRANQLAHRLRALGVGPETPVGICMERSPEMVVGLLGILKAGGAYVPFDPAYPRERLAFMLADTKRREAGSKLVVLTQPWLAGTLPEHEAHLVRLDSHWETLAGEPDDNPGNLTRLNNLAYIIYTSGTTGRPKGIQIEHRGLLNLIYWHQRAFAVTAKDRATQLAGPAFDASVWELWPYLTLGASIHIPDDETRALPWRLQAWLIDKAITITFLPTPLAEAVLLLEWPQEAALRILLTGGDKLHRPPRPGLPFDLVNNYGPTENTVVTTFGHVPPAGQNGRTPAIGRPIDTTTIYVVDAHLNPLPIGVPGELLIGGDSLARGYLDRPELTATAFIPNPFSDEVGARLYRTGDLVRTLPDGQLEFLGRIDHQVKIRGFRIELGEVEVALRQHPAVAEAAVLAREDGPGDKRLVAYVVLDEKETPATAELRRFLTQKLPDYMIPATFVALLALPLTPNGKVDRRALPAPDWATPETTAQYLAPRTHAEQSLADIWAGVLGLPRVGIHDNFFELGGDSILSIQILARANQAGLHLTPRQLFQHQTIAALAETAGNGLDLTRLAEQEPVSGPVPLTPIQHWFFAQELPEPHHWNMAMMLAVGQAVEPSLLERAVRQALAHHDAFRLRFRHTPAGWQQEYVAPTPEIPFSWKNLSALPQGEQEQAIQTAAEQLQASLDLAQGPLAQVAYFDLGRQRPGRLLIIAHHLVIDGVSWRILLEDLDAVYCQLGQAGQARLPFKTTSFKAWAEKLAAYARSEALRQEATHWLELPWEQVQSLPVDDAAGRSGNTVASAQTISRALEEAETRQLIQQVPAAYGAHINDVLLAALAQALGRWSGAPALLVDLEGHGREEIDAAVDVSRTVGWFTAIFPVVLPGGQDSSLRQTLTFIQAQRERLPDRGIGYGLLRYLRDDPALAQQLQALPQAQISFNYLGQFDQLLPPDSPFALTEESNGNSRSRQGRRPYLLQVNAQISGGRLRVNWTYSQNIHRPATVERLATEFLAALRTLIQDRPRPGESAMFSSDFPLVALEPKALQQVLDSYPPVEDIYPLSPAQQEMLRQALASPASETYFLQWRYLLQGALDVEALRCSWRRVIERHPTLRTVFASKGLAEPLQVVLRETPVPWEAQDWRGLDSVVQQEQLQSFLQADRERGFDLAHTPPLRLAVLRLAEETHLFVWSYHHLLLDGWSMAPLWQEVLAFYEGFSQGRELHLERPRPYREYIAWLLQQDQEKARAFWQQALDGLGEATTLGGRPPAAGAGGQSVWREQTAWLPEETTAALQALAQQNRLTLNTLVQGAWAQVLAHHTGRDEVVFGVATASRPAALPGVENMIGLFVSALPLRLSVPRPGDRRQASMAWLQEVQAQQLAISQYEYVSLEQVQAWSSAPAGQPLFESFLRFQNYPMKHFLNSWRGSLKIQEEQRFDFWHYPLNVVVVPESRLLLRLGYDAHGYEQATINRLLASFQETLESFLKKG
ncbi:MAG: amino acid adenylation domain-containing protein [Chloroflexi bacterium]|nr:amino acid adenylation domain-containing protein [Chloroflexota bacterium]MCI0580297.1 amino acid adenylation domain-containing protein [Chloroflexota bacterium]MCI0648084.1 amino acid adenylation domain-containing protein [Chloroflexota bacterium]MCI0730915.1 amino acid adenylation domain-containing protein [Chloroflexota bacterium]